MLTLAMLFSIAVPAFANDTNEKDTYDYTLGEIQDMLLTYFEENNIDIEIGTEEYFEYITEQLIYGTDKNLKAHPHYNLIHAYMAEYSNAYADQCFYQEGVLRTSEMKYVGEQFYNSLDFSSETLGDIRLQNELERLTVQNMPQTRSVVSSVYDGEAAAEYAILWARGENPNYEHYSKDCTNFVSQCIYAGGIDMNGSCTAPGVYDTTSDWYSQVFYTSNASGNYQYKEFGVTTSWIRVADLYTYLLLNEGKTSSSCHSHSLLIDNVEVGDIVQLYDETTFSTHHSIIITDVSADDAEYCAHSTNRKSTSVREIDTTHESFVIIHM